MTTNITTPLVLVDGSSFLFRAYHALPPLTNSKGQATGAMYGVLNMLKRLMTDYNPEHIAVVFDPKGKTFRNDLYPQYKANRPPMPDDLREQIQPLFKIIKAMGLPLIIVDNVEADDVIGTLAAHATKKNLNTIVATSDKDMAQLVNQHITLVNTMSNTTLDIDGVINKFGVAPERIIDYLALIGDTSDNVPGVAKVGPKTAVKWLGQYQTLDNIIAKADEFKGKVGENLRDSLDFLPLSKQLVTIKCDVELDFDWPDLNPKPADKAELKQLYQLYEFKNWLKLLEASSDEATNKPSPYKIILTTDELQTWLEKIKAAKLIAFDTETTSLNYMQAELVGVSFAIKPGEAIYIPFGHDYMGAPKQLSKQEVLEAITPILENDKPVKIGQHLKYDANVLANHGIKLRGIGFDSMLESYVYDSTATRHDMDSLAEKYLHHQTTTFTDVAGKGVKQLTFNQVPLETAGPYAAEDADITLQLHECLWPKIKSDKKLLSVFETIEMPLLPILAQMEQHGVLIDTQALVNQSRALTKQLTTLEEDIYNLAGETFNVNSTKQLQVILYEKLNLPILQKTPKGQASTAESVLQELAIDYELPKIILEYRSLSKLKSTYTDKLPELIDPKTKRIHTSYHQAVTTTGRLSSSDPNLQNIPIRTHEGRQIRQAFIAPPGYSLIAADYSQIELRIMAHLSADPGLLAAFKQGLDVHKATAAEVHGVSIDEVTNEQRRSAKAINFGLIYGMSAFGLAKQLGIERHLAQEYMDIYFHRYPNVQAYMEKTREIAHKQGYVETLFGRKLNLPDINSRNIQRQKAIERAAINAPMQGTAADIIKKAMLCVQQQIEKHNIDAYLIMQVHDELVLEVADAQCEQMQKLLTDCMTQAAQLSVPLLVEVGIGKNWDEAH